MTTTISSIAQLSVEGFDRAARQAVVSLGQPATWKREVIQDITELQVRPCYCSNTDLLG